MGRQKEEFAVTQPTLEQRVNSLEQTVAGLVAAAAGVKRTKDWRRTVGMFEGDPVMREIQEEGRRLREAERRAAQQDGQS
jgi:hypothetical protein